MPEFLSSLAIAGVDGTMRKRFRKSDLKGHAHVKTGTIRGTTGIVGYVLDRHGERWIVVSLMNNPRLQSWRGKGVENALLRWVYEEAEDYKGVQRIHGAGEGALADPSSLQVNATPTDWFLSPDAPTP